MPERVGTAGVPLPLEDKELVPEEVPEEAGLVMVPMEALRTALLEA